MAAELVTGEAANNGVLPAEAREVAREMASAYKRMVEFYRKNLKDEDGAPLTTDAARAMVEDHRGQLVEDIQERLRTDPKQISWHDLETLTRHDPVLSYEAWQEIKSIALEAHQLGVPAIEASQDVYGQGPYERAQMLAFRHELRRGWQPQSGIEDAIIEQMALAHWQYYRWMNRLAVVESINDRYLKREEPGQAVLPRVDQAQASDTAAQMVDRFNRVFLRCVRSLRDLRRYPIIVQNAGQVNIGEKQVNISK